jgi:hypothetical protein
MRIIEAFIPILTDDFEGTVSRYEKLTGQRATPSWTNTEAGVIVAEVRPFMVIAGPDETIERMKVLRAVLYIDDLDQLKKLLAADPKAEPVRESVQAVGKTLFVRHADGALIEYIQRPAA